VTRTQGPAIVGKRDRFVYAKTNHAINLGAGAFRLLERQNDTMA